MLKIYNSLTRQKELFTPKNRNHVAMYVCGPNLYAPSHVGHAFSYIVFDTIKRYLKFRGYSVHHVQNFTDIEDRIITTAKEQNTTIQALADHYIDRFLNEMDALNVERANAYPRATYAIEKIIEVNQTLLSKGYAYELNGDVFFRVRKINDYGKLAHRSLDDMEAGARVEIDSRKEDPMDFALWKAQKPGEPGWHCPWGIGRPGWHIECTAMNLIEHGEQIDIHGGGHDVIFPHHENEIAQTEAFTGKKPFVRYWIHNALLRLAGAKEEMHRHIRNTLWIKDALTRHDPDSIRLYLLSTHYRSSMAWVDNDVDATARGLERWRVAMENGITLNHEIYENSFKKSGEKARKKFIEAMDDDFGTPQAIAVLYKLAKDINRARDEGVTSQALAPAQATLRELANVLGLRLKTSMEEAKSKPFIELLISIREELRSSKQFTLADKIRCQLEQNGVVIEDGSKVTKWKLKK